MKKLSVFFSVIILLNSCKKMPASSSEESAVEAVSTMEIDALIRNSVKDKGYFNWNTTPVNIVWSALQQSDNVLSVGYTIPGFDMNNIHLVNIQSEEWLMVKNRLIRLILQEERKLDATLTEEHLIQWNENFLPVLNVFVRNPATLRLLRANKLVRYAEPMGYEPQDVKNKVLSSSGCDSNLPTSGLLEGVDFVSVFPGSKQSWNYNFHRIPAAWQKSTGAGVKVFIIDTGSELDQDNLGTAFNQGSSAGRTIERMVTLPRATFLGIPTGPVETADDGCGHGTTMAGVCAAPRGIDGAPCGVAYNCNLVTCRAAEDVLIDASREVKGVSDAFINAGNRSDVKIISMSMGRITSSSQIADAIKYAYGKAKLIFCAAGTSFGWTSGWYGVIFPAYLSQVSAVTGVRDNQFNTTCTTCHDGAETDFTIVMEKALNERHPLTLASTGNAPSTVGGSSVSTATAAGIAALVWSRFPAYTRDQVLNKLIATSANYPIRNVYLGWGNMNADAATN